MDLTQPPMTLAAARFANQVMRTAILDALADLHREAGEIHELALHAQLGDECDLSRIAFAVNHLRGRIHIVHETMRRNDAALRPPILFSAH